MIYFDLEGRDYIELCSLLKITGLCDSGGVAKLLIGDGLVKVDDQTETRKRCKIRAGQVIEFDGQLITVS